MSNQEPERKSVGKCEDEGHRQAGDFLKGYKSLADMQKDGSHRQAGNSLKGCAGLADMQKDGSHRQAGDFLKGCASLADMLKNDERADDLQRNGYHIIQKKTGFCFGMDAVLLSGFAWAKRGERVLDLGTGTGIIPILMEAKTEGEHFTGLEIQEEVVDMARRSVRLNGLEERVSIVQGDIKEASRIFGKASFDVVTSNPPYMNDRHGLKNPKLPKAIARHEVLCTLEDVVREAGAVLKPGGRFYLVHRPRRLAEIISLLREYRLEPKRMKLVHPFVDREANMVLVEAARGGKAMMKVEAPVIVFQEPGVYTEEMYTTYGY